MRSFLLTLFLLGSAPILSAATVPYSQGFGSGGVGDPTPAEFTETSPTHWTLQPPLVGGEYQNLMSVSGTMFSLVSLTTSAGLPFPDLPGTSFTMSTGFTLDTLTVTGTIESRAFAGFAVLATDANYAATVGPRYQLLYVLDGVLEAKGSLALGSFNAPGSTILAASTGTLPVTLGTPYTLTITGTYSGGGLMLSGTLSSSAGSISVADSETGPILTGTHFGFLGNVAATGASSVSTLDIDYDFLMVESAAEDSADFDSDEDVDGEDFLAWQHGFGIVGDAGRTDGDADGDLDVDGDDFHTWQRQFGSVAAGDRAAAVPEPATLAMLASATLAIFFRRCIAVS